MSKAVPYLTWIVVEILIKKSAPTNPIRKKEEIHLKWTPKFFIFTWLDVVLHLWKININILKNAFLITDSDLHNDSTFKQKYNNSHVLWISLEKIYYEVKITTNLAMHKVKNKKQLILVTTALFEDFVRKILRTDLGKINSHSFGKCSSFHVFWCMVTCHICMSPCDSMKNITHWLSK